MKDPTRSIRRIDLKVNCRVLGAGCRGQQGGTKRHTYKLKVFHKLGYAILQKYLLQARPLCKGGEIFVFRGGLTTRPRCSVPLPHLKRFVGYF